MAEDRRTRPAIPLKDWCEKWAAVEKPVDGEDRPLIAEIYTDAAPTLKEASRQGHAVMAPMTVGARFCFSKRKCQASKRQAVDVLCGELSGAGATARTTLSHRKPKRQRS